MRYLVGLVCVLAFAVLGCSDDGGTGGRGGEGGGGSSGSDGLGSGGAAGNGGGGVGGGGATGGIGLGICEFVCPCRIDTACDESTGECFGEAVEDGVECELPKSTGICIGGDCRFACESPDRCDDQYNDCTVGVCAPPGYCDGQSAVEDGTPCAGGTCQTGVCELASLTLPCSEQGIHNALAAGGGPYTFDCDGLTRIPQSYFSIERDVILDGEGTLVVEAFDVRENVVAELHGFRFLGSSESIGNSGTLLLTNSTLSDNDLGINNNGTMTVMEVTVSGNARGGVFNVGTMVLSNSTISDNGGTGISNRGTMTLSRTVVSGNTDVKVQVDDIAPGGIWNGPNGVMSLESCTVSGNIGRALGASYDVGNTGGIANDGTMTMTNSTVSGNTGEGNRTPMGGVANDGTMTMTNSTVSGNRGIGIRNQGIMTMLSCTVSAYGVTGFPVIDAAGGTLTVGNTLLDGDTCRAFEDAGALVSMGHNIESPFDTCGFDLGKGDQVAVSAEDLNLALLLTDNGGPTETLALGESSVAIDQIPAEECLDAEGAPLTTDQRGFPRDSMCDVGAFEVQP